jgi:hypothetical protein
MPYDANADQISSGYKGYAGVFAQRRKYDYSDKVIQKSRVHAKMFNILSKNLTKMSATDLEPRIFEFTTENDVIAINNNPTTGTTFEFANVDAQQLQQHDKLFILINSITTAPSQETIHVVSVGAKDGGPSGAGYTAVTVRRGGSPINIADGSAYSVVWGGYTTGESQGGPGIRTKTPNYVYNYLELFAKMVGESRDVKNSQFYAKSFFSIEGQMTRARDLLMKQINATFYLGERNRETTEDGNYRHYTGGLYEDIPTANKLSLSGNNTISYWNQQSSLTWFKQGNDRSEKMCSAGPAFMVQVENMFHAFGYELKINDKISNFFGVQIKSFDFSGGTLHFLREESFLETGYSNAGFIWDPDFIAYMYMANEDIQVHKDVTNNDEKWNKTQWLIEGRIGLFRSYAAAHHFLYNPSAPS